jgi:protein TonB
MLKAVVLVLPVLFACAANSRSAGTTCEAVQGSLSLADTTVYDTTQVTTRPLILSGPDLHYPDRARQEGIQGRVVLAVVVNADGKVEPSSVRVAEVANYQLEREATRYARGALFQPACLDGRPVRVRVRLPIDFKISR